MKFTAAQWHYGYTRKMVEAPRFLSSNLHLMSLSSCELRTKCLTLFKSVAAVIFLGESDRCSSDKIAMKLNTRKPQQRVVMAFLRLVWCHGFVTVLRFCLMSNQRWHWFHTLQITQCAAIITNVKSSVRNSHFFGRKVFDATRAGRNNDNCIWKGTGKFGKKKKSFLFFNLYRSY